MIFYLLIHYLPFQSLIFALVGILMDKTTDKRKGINIFFDYQG